MAISPDTRRMIGGSRRAPAGENAIPTAPGGRAGDTYRLAAYHPNDFYPVATRGSTAGRVRQLLKAESADRLVPSGTRGTSTLRPVEKGEVGLYRRRDRLG